jgi:hypothetical protein
MNKSLVCMYKEHLQIISHTPNNWTIVQYSHLSTSLQKLQSLGEPCLGPRSLCRNAIQEYCPNKSIIDFASATICPKIGLNQISLRTRCDLCFWEHGRINRLKGLGILANSDQGPKCLRKKCPELRWNRTSHCVKHFSASITKNNVLRKRHAQQRILDAQRIQGPQGKRPDDLWISGDA